MIRYAFLGGKETLDRYMKGVVLIRTIEVDSSEGEENRSGRFVPSEEALDRFVLLVWLGRIVLRRRHSPVVQSDHSEVGAVQEQQSLRTLRVVLAAIYVVDRLFPIGMRPTVSRRWQNQPMLALNDDSPVSSRTCRVNAFLSDVLECRSHVVDREATIEKSNVVVLAVAADEPFLVVGLFVADVVVDAAFV